MSILNLNTILPIIVSGSLLTFVEGENVNTVFVELLVYDLNDVLVNENIIPIANILNDSLFIYSDRFIINPGVHLRELGYANGTYKIKYNFFKKIVGDFSDSNKLLTMLTISPSRTEIAIFIPNDKTDSNSEEINNFINKEMIELSYYTFFGNDRNFSIINKMKFNNNLLLKLYDALPDDIGILSNLTIVQKLVNSYEDTITLRTEFIDDLSGLNILSGPKINYKVAGLTYRTTNLENFETLASTEINKIDEITRLYLSSSLIEGIDTNIDYRKYENFIHFSSAEQRLKNFRNKIRKIEFFDSKLTEFGNANITGAVSSSLLYYRGQKNHLINTFDQYEQFMYYKSSSYESSSLGVFPDAVWPKYTSPLPYVLYSVTSSQAMNWYNSVIVSASEYDNLNPNILTNTVPIEIVLDDQNSQYITYVQMTGHILDINYNYVNRMTSINERQNCIFDGIPRELILPAINHYGFDLRSGNVIKGLVECIPSSSITGSI